MSAMFKLPRIVKDLEKKVWYHEGETYVFDSETPEYRAKEEFRKWCRIDVDLKLAEQIGWKRVDECFIDYSTSYTDWLSAYVKPKGYVLFRRKAEVIDWHCIFSNFFVRLFIAAWLAGTASYIVCSCSERHKEKVREGISTSYEKLIEEANQK